MADVLIIGDTFRSPELRHEVPLGVPDPFVYLELDGARHVYVGSMRGRPDRGAPSRLAAACRSRRYGDDELMPQASSSTRSGLRSASRARHVGLIDAAVVPHDVPGCVRPSGCGEAGIELTVDQAVLRRRAGA